MFGGCCRGNVTGRCSDVELSFRAATAEATQASCREEPTLPFPSVPVQPHASSGLTRILERGGGGSRRGDI